MAASEFSYITTPRLELRPVTQADVPALLKGIGNYDVARWLGRVPYPYRAADAEAFVAANSGLAGRVWFIHSPEGLVGGMSIDSELGYWLARTAWGKGYATEAATAAVAAHFARKDAGDLTTGSYPGNDRSARVLLKLGFEPAGTRIVAARALAQQIESQLWRLTRPRWLSHAPDLSGIAFSATRPGEEVGT